MALKSTQKDRLDTLLSKTPLSEGIPGARGTRGDMAYTTKRDAVARFDNGRYDQGLTKEQVDILKVPASVAGKPRETSKLLEALTQFCGPDNTKSTPEQKQAVLACAIADVPDLKARYEQRQSEIAAQAERQAEARRAEAEARRAEEERQAEARRAAQEERAKVAQEEKAKVASLERSKDLKTQLASSGEYRDLTEKHKLTPNGNMKTILDMENTLEGVVKEGHASTTAKKSLKENIATLAGDNPALKKLVNHLGSILRQEMKKQGLTVESNWRHTLSDMFRSKKEQQKTRDELAKVGIDVKTLVETMKKSTKSASAGVAAAPAGKAKQRGKADAGIADWR